MDVKRLNNFSLLQKANKLSKNWRVRGRLSIYEGQKSKQNLDPLQCIFRAGIGSSFPVKKKY